MFPCSSSTLRGRGQALVLALFLLLAGALALVQLFDGGQRVHEKARLTHAADAAAYSGALVQARALNFQAYANRAQVAHQVAMAHLVTLASWAHFGDTEARQAGIGNPPISVVAMMFGAGHGAAYAAALAAAGAAAQAGRDGALGRAFDAHDRTVHEVLWRAQQAVAEGLPAAREAAMRAVVAANYPGATPITGGRAELDADMLADDLPGLLAIHRLEGRARLRDVVLRATAEYAFLDGRNHTARNGWIVSGRCPHLRHELRRRGGTALDGYDTWRAYDTQSYHALRSNRWIGCYYREYPMGWADAAAGTDIQGSTLQHIAHPPADFSQQDFWRWVQDHTDWDIFSGRDNPLANSRAVQQAIRWRGRGMPGYVDVAGEHGSGTPARFAIRVLRPAADLAVPGAASRVHRPRGVFGLDNALPGEAMAAVSAAETYFERPVSRADGRDELASLFNPYWQARLSPVLPQERQQAWRRQGVS